jgi:hypothetical protein
VLALEEALGAGRVSKGTLERLGLPDLVEVFRADTTAGLRFAQGMTSVAAGQHGSAGPGS